jgi:hypothetical protein
MLIILQYRTLTLVIPIQHRLACGPGTLRPFGSGESVHADIASVVRRPAIAVRRGLCRVCESRGQQAFEDAVEWFPQGGQTGDEDADGELCRAPNGEIDAVPCGIFSFRDLLQFDGFENGAYGSAGASLR